MSFVASIRSKRALKVSLLSKSVFGNNFSLKEKDDVRLFLLASGVEYESLHSENFPINDLAQFFVDNGGHILSCGTCLNLRQQESSELCPLSNLKDLYELIRDCDKTVTF